MRYLKLTLRPRSPFGTPLAGDTLFGHLCWALRLRRGAGGLGELLEGYTEGRPFAVISDAFPAGFIPRPALPGARAGRVFDPRLRKEDKRKTWLPVSVSHLPIGAWLDAAAEPQGGNVVRTGVMTQNTINRMTGTTGTGPFAPRQVEQIVFARDALLECYATLDEARLPAQELRRAAEDIGCTGYGRDASSGLGKFDVVALEDHTWPNAGSAHAITLAPCSPEPAALDGEDCYYQPVTRFGRHGGTAVLTGPAGPFKRPILMMRTAAFLTFREAAPRGHHGKGLGGVAQPISGVIPETVHQGYAPLVPVNATPGGG